MLLTISNTTASVVTVGGTIGSLKPGQTKELDVRVDEVEKVRSRLATLEAAGLVSWFASENRNSGDNAGEFLPLSNQMTKTSRAITLFVDASTGNNANSGSRLEPLASIDEVWNRVPDLVAHDVVVNVAPHPGAGYSWSSTVYRQFTSNAKIEIYFSEFAELLSSTAAGAGSNNTLVDGTGFTDNAFRGKTIEILSGAAAGDRRTVERNTTTAIYPAALFSAAVAPGDTYRIVEPDAGNVILPPVDAPLVASSDVLSTSPPYGDFSSGFRLINTHLAPTTQDLRFSAGARLGLIGCEITYAGAFSRGYISGGELLLGSGSSMAALSSSLTDTDTQWLGWGLNYDAHFPVWLNSTGVVRGFIVSPRYVVFSGRHFIAGNIHSGPIRAIADSAFEHEAIHVSFGVQAPGATPPLGVASRVNNTQGAFVSAIQCEGARATVWVGTGTVIDSVTNGVQASDGANIQIYAGWTLNTAVDGARSLEGGRISYATTPTLGTVSGSQISVGNTPATATFASVSAGSFVTDTTLNDGSIVQRSS